MNVLKLISQNNHALSANLDRVASVRHKQIVKIINKKTLLQKYIFWNEVTQQRGNLDKERHFFVKLLLLYQIRGNVCEGDVVLSDILQFRISLNLLSLGLR